MWGCQVAALCGDTLAPDCTDATPIRFHALRPLLSEPARWNHIIVE